ncbi:MAG: nucleotidyltransferase domain-containing protein [Candidatus Melainabacteria bacterium]|nr:nucleotidyltransferase domain-containing protein [Candidatus Melainabacteria bacterium]
MTNFPDVAGIWLFGSRESGMQSPDSDIDLAVLPSCTLDRIKLWECAQSIGSKIGKNVDLIDLLEASTVLRAQIINTGKRIYCSDRLKCDLFETETLADYVRFTEERRELLEDIKSRRKVFGEHG